MTQTQITELINKILLIALLLSNMVLVPRSYYSGFDAGIEQCVKTPKECK